MALAFVPPEYRLARGRIAPRPARSKYNTHIQSSCILN